jgi:pimeloyl-ACP methyl ester carboxylesterase
MGGRYVDIEFRGRPIRLEIEWVNEDLRHTPLVVFLHEGLGSVALWRGFPQTLCHIGGFRGLVFSRYGYGSSTRRPHGERWTADFMHEQALDVLPKLLDAAGADRAWLFGHSDGASIALVFAAAHPDRASGLVLLAPHVFVEDVTIQSIERARGEYRAGRLKARLAPYHDDPDSAFWGWNDAWLDPAFRHWSIENVLGSVGCPVLVIQGKDDEYGTRAQLERIARDVAGAELLELPNCRHAPYRDQPQAVTSAAIKFIKAHVAPGSTTR